jgi:hypothetical protein
MVAKKLACDLLLNYSLRPDFVPCFAFLAAPFEISPVSTSKRQPSGAPRSRKPLLRGGSRICPAVVRQMEAPPVRAKHASIDCEGSSPAHPTSRSLISAPLTRRSPRPSHPRAEEARPAARRSSDAIRQGAYHREEFGRMTPDCNPT